MEEIVSRENAGPEHIDPLRRLGTEIAQADAYEAKYPEELLENRPVGARTHPRCIQPRQCEEDEY